ncbi:hypothetical protein PVAND_010091 [Polypedilum vanderplanki]|uniref:ZP domain-containing protein n=1 Tax=Polypedilum vanderplanki TaxID=319348 RepID=A0A9J6CFN1_POLVA|nr:hypothetical protein PVAND_010091 [Polypedilum vanderplanki]
MGRQFKGMLFAKGFMEECNSRAGSNLLTLPLTSCGVKSRMLSKDIMQHSVQIVVQHSSKLQQKSDMLVNAICDMATEMMDYNIDNHEMKTQRSGRMRFFKTSSTKIRPWLEIESSKPDYAIVGENATLSAIAIVPRNIGMRIIDCIAFDGVGDSSQKLFDENGCAVDNNIMPEFEETIVNVEDGWSKSNEDDIVKKVFSTKFQAFKFPDKDIIHFNCGIILCKGDCPKECNYIVENQLLQKPLARLEIFNSIRVIAPQIESVDRMGRNLTVTEKAQAQSAYLGPDVLCVSQSRLAIAFCVLGLIFLLAVIIAIVCSIRYLSQRRNYRRARPPSDHSGRRSIFSLSSSSNNFSQSSLEIDSKLFAYGRVY